MTLELFLKALLIVSVLTGLFTQAIKKQLDELKKTYFANMLAGVISVLTALIVGTAYVVLKDIVFNSTVLIYIIILALMSWLCAMTGYDKVIQSIQQVLTNSKEEKED